MTRGSVNVYHLKEDAVLNDIYKSNLEHAKQIILSEAPPEKHGDLVTFSPTLFVITKEKVYYILLDTVFAGKHKESPLEQVIPILSQMLTFDEKYGEILAYQTVAEGWGAKDIGNNYKHGDIEKMASRQEVLISIVQEKGKSAQSTTYEIIREINSNKVKELKLESEGEIKNESIPKTPPIPTDPKRLKIIKDGITKMMDEIKNNPNTNLGFHALEQHTQNWEPNYEGKDNA